MRYIPIATIRKPHGIHGALKVRSDTDFKENRYKICQKLYIEHKQTYLPVTVQKHQIQKDGDILSFEEFEQVETVEKYRGCNLYIAQSDRENLSEDTFYYVDLEGMQVKDDTNLIGEVIKVVEMPQSAMLRVKKNDGKEILIPFLKVFIASVDHQQKTIQIKTIEGLL